MKQRFVMAVLAAIAGATPAAAQSVAPSGALPPAEVLTIVRSAGLDPLGQPIRRGSHYALRAIGDGEREVNVLVDARSGGILSITPVSTASRVPPRGVPADPDAEPGLPPGMRLGPYERVPGPGYVSPEPPVVYGGRPGVYRMGPPVVYESDPPVIYGNRPPADIPGAPEIRRGPPPVITATPSDEIASSAPNAVAPGRAGALPPPPERFPQRLPPVSAEKPKPEKKAIAAVPKLAPLPKPRPAAASPAAVSPAAESPTAPANNIDAVPPLAPETKPDGSAVPH